MSAYDALKSLDHRHLWHPFTQAKQWIELEPLIVERGEGHWLFDVAGNRYLDGISSLWCNVHGHSVPKLSAAISEQATKLCHSTLLGLSHRPILELTEELVKFLPSNLSRCFYCDSGSAAVEAALRMALEWWYHQDTPSARKKSMLLSLEGAYHGDTLGAVSVGFAEKFHQAVAGHVLRPPKITPPHILRFEKGLSAAAAEEESIEEVESILRQYSAVAAALIIEPLVQGAAGIWVHSADYLRSVSELCRKYDVLLIVDEVATGFGKTGTMFAVEQSGAAPDLMVIGKGLSGGTVPISAVCASEKIFQGFIGEPEEFKTFFFGQTFAGNPIAAAASLANLQLFNENKVLEALPAKIELLRALLEEKVSVLEHVDEIRQCGLMVGIEFTQKKGKRLPYPTSALAGPRVVAEARRLGLIIRPLGNTMVLMPALSMAAKELELLVDTVSEAITAVLAVEGAIG